MSYNVIDSSTLLCNRYTDAHTRHRETKDRVCATPDSVSIPALRPGSELTAVVMLLLQAVKKTATEYTSQGEGRREEGAGVGGVAGHGAAAAQRQKKLISHWSRRFYFTRYI